MTKKKLLLTMSMVVMSLFILTACGSKPKEPVKSDAKSETKTEQVSDTSTPGGGYVGKDTCKSCHGPIYNDYQMTWHGKMTHAGVPIEDWEYFKTLGKEAFDAKTGNNNLYADIETTMNELAKVVTKEDGTEDWTQVNPDNVKVWSAGSLTVEIKQRKEDKWFLTAEFYHTDKHIELLKDEKEFAATGGWEEYTCYGCHITGTAKQEDSAVFTEWLTAVTKGEKPGFDLGITCESCHGQGGNHLQKPGKGNIVNPANFSIKEQTVGVANGFLDEKAQAYSCSGCHRGAKHQGEFYSEQTIKLTDGSEVTTGPSTHFTSGKVGCNTCHDSHKLNKEGKQINAESAVETCTACHAGKNIDIEKFMPRYMPHENQHRHDFPGKFE